nr:hypothetical protein [uncultured Undibacterium sp.]
MNEKNKAVNRKKYKTSLPAPKASTLEDEETEQLSVVEQFKKVKAEQHQTLLQKLQQKYK